MASGGRQSCSVCLNSDRDTAARHYCLQCEAYFCAECVKCHILPALKGHQVNELVYSNSDIEGSDTLTRGTVSGSDDASGLRCTIHKEKKIDTYCQEHDDVCCRACAVVKHRTCTTMSISIASKNYKTSQEMKTYRDKMTANLVQCKQENEKRKKNRENIDKEKLELIENVNSHEERIITRIKELAEASRQEIRSKHEKDKTDLDNHIDALDVVIATNADYINSLDNADHEELFAIVKMNGKTVLKDGEMLLENLTKDWKEKHVTYRCNQAIDKCVTDMTSLGHIGNDVVSEDIDERDSNGYVATFHSHAKLKQHNDTDSALVDICVVDSDNILVTDHNNYKLLRLNVDLKFVDAISLSEAPIAVCKTGHREVAVRFSGKKCVKIMSIGQSMKIISSFKLDGDGWGMTYDAETKEVYVCEETQISVYSKQGNKLRTYELDANGMKMFTQCMDIRLSDNKKDIYVTDEKNGLLVLHKDGTLKMKVAVPGVRFTWPLCLLPGNICLVGCRDTGMIAQIDRHGKKIGNLIDRIGGREMTFCAVYDRERERLIIGGRPNVISTYILSVTLNETTKLKQYWTLE